MQSTPGGSARRVERRTIGHRPRRPAFGARAPPRPDRPALRARWHRCHRPRRERRRRSPRADPALESAPPGRRPGNDRGLPRPPGPPLPVRSAPRAPPAGVLGADDTGHRADPPPFAGDARPDARCRALAAHPLPAGRARDELRRRTRFGRPCRRGHEDSQPVPRAPHLRRTDGGGAAKGHPLRGSAGHRQDLHGKGDVSRGGRPLPLRLIVSLPVDVLRTDQSEDPRVLPGTAKARQARRRCDRLHRGARRHRWRARKRAPPWRGCARGRQRAPGAAPVLRAADAAVVSTEGVGHRRGQRLAAEPPAARPAGCRAGQHLGDRRHQPGVRSRPGPPAPRPLRSEHLLRTAEPLGAPRHHRLLPGQEGPPTRARRPRQAPDARRAHRRVLAGDDRAPDGRGARVGAATRSAASSPGTTSSTPR